jgi:hypothetical protein
MLYPIRCKCGHIFLASLEQLNSRIVCPGCGKGGHATTPLTFMPEHASQKGSASSTTKDTLSDPSIECRSRPSTRKEYILFGSLSRTQKVLLFVATITAVLLAYAFVPSEKRVTLESSVPAHPVGSEPSSAEMQDQLLRSFMKIAEEQKRREEVFANSPAGRAFSKCWSCNGTGSAAYVDSNGRLRNSKCEKCLGRGTSGSIFSGSP